MDTQRRDMCVTAECGEAWANVGVPIAANIFHSASKAAAEANDTPECVSNMSY